MKHLLIILHIIRQTFIKRVCIDTIDTKTHYHYVTFYILLGDVNNTLGII